MQPRILVSRLWSDDDVVELACEVCDGTSIHTNRVYVARDWGTVSTAALRTFGTQTHGGLFDLEAGQRGSEYASGHFWARFHYYTSRQIFIETSQQSAFFQFKDRHVATEATAFLRTEPALLDQFVAGLARLDAPDGPPAMLQCETVTDA